MIHDGDGPGQPVHVTDGDHQAEHLLSENGWAMDKAVEAYWELRSERGSDIDSPNSSEKEREAA